MPLDVTDRPAPDFTPTLPLAIQRQVERAEAAARGIGAANVPGPASAPADPAPPAEKAPAVVQSPERAPDGAASPSPAVVQERPGDGEDYRQQYLTLQGKYNAETSAQRAQIERLQSQIDGLTGLLGRVQQPAAPPAPVQAAPVTPVVSPDQLRADADTYGDELITAARRWARHEVSAELDALRQQVRQLAENTQQVQQQTSKMSLAGFFDADPVVGKTWRTLNNDQKFLTWLSQVDPFAGQSRQDMLNDAVARGQFERAAAFFRAYVQQQTAAGSPPVVPPPHTPPGAPAPASAGPQVSLADLASPGRPVSPAAPAQQPGAPASQRIWTQADVRAFYRDSAHGKYAGRETERARIEADIFAAQVEGRIR